MKYLTIATIAALAAGPVFAGDAGPGDAAKGEKTFNKCKSCHSITAPDGTKIVKGGRTGPNLYGVVGRPIASTDFKYSKSLAAVGESGEVWDFDHFTHWVMDPKGWLKETTGDSKAKSKMTYKLKKGGEDVFAYLASVAPAAAEESDESTESN